MRFRDGGGRVAGDADRNRHAARDAAEDPAGVIRLRHDSAGRDRERIVVLAPAHRRRAEAGAEIDAFHGGYREEERSGAPPALVEKMAGDAPPADRLHPPDPAAHAVA